MLERIEEVILNIMPAADDHAIPNGNHGEAINGFATNGASHVNGTSTDSSVNIPLNNQYAFTPRKLKVVTIGAGFSGLMMAHKFQHRFSEMQDFIEHTIFERHNNLGGTWLVNTYPGVQCDVPSHIYVGYTGTCAPLDCFKADIYQGVSI